MYTQQAGFSNGAFKVYWFYNQTTDTIHFKVEVMTTGWVGFGITVNNVSSGIMNGFDIVTGGVAADGNGSITVIIATQVLKRNY